MGDRGEQVLWIAATCIPTIEEKTRAENLASITPLSNCLGNGRLANSCKTTEPKDTRMAEIVIIDPCIYRLKQFNASTKETPRSKGKFNRIVPCR
jgi:hypothetical protein